MNATTDSYRNDKSAAFNWAAGVAGALVLAALSTATVKLLSHDTILAVNSQRIEQIERRSERVEQKIDSIMDRLGVKQP